MRYYVIADPETVRGFEVLGIKGCSPEGKDQVCRSVREAISDCSIGTILISEEHYESARTILEEHEKRGVMPAVMKLVR